jgi:hypothetical protein
MIHSIGYGLTGYGAVTVATVHKLFRSYLETVRAFVLTNGRTPEASSTAFSAQPPDSHPVTLIDMGFVVNCHLARHTKKGRSEERPLVIQW